MRTINFTGKITTREPLMPGLRSGTRLPRNGGPSATPYFPAYSIRGAIRHAAYQVVIEHLSMKNNGVVPLEQAEHLILAKGIDIDGRTNAGLVGRIDARNYMRTKNPMLSLFGVEGFTGKTGISNAMPADGDKWAISEGDGERNVEGSVDACESFTTGSELSHRMSVRNVTDIEAGFFLAALLRFASNPRLGGYSEHHCGLVEATWQ
ncbi:TPA: hypothetical protein R5S02_004404 [Salmonella enterica]|nr:hypothetical protein [Salmonella enterica]